MNKTIFKVGDKVHYYPYHHRVFELEENNNKEYPLMIFTDHTLPVLTLVESKPENEDWYQVFYKFKKNPSVYSAIFLVKSKEHFLTMLGSKESDFEFIVFKKVNMESDL